MICKIYNLASFFCKLIKNNFFVVVIVLLYHFLKDPVQLVFKAPLKNVIHSNNTLKQDSCLYFNSHNFRSLRGASWICQNLWILINSVRYHQIVIMVSSFRHNTFSVFFYYTMILLLCICSSYMQFAISGDPALLLSQLLFFIDASC